MGSIPDRGKLYFRGGFMQNEGYVTLEEHKNYIAYVENAAEQRINAYGKQYRKKINDSLRLEITAIQEMLEYVQEPEKSRIEKRIARIMATLTKND